MTLTSAGFRSCLGLGCFLLAATASFAAEDRQALESSLFSEAEGTSAPAVATPPASALITAPDAKTVGFSGQLTSAITDRASNTQTADYLYTLTVADIYLDARLPQLAKVFANVEATYLSQAKLTNVAIQELFLDFNVANTVYFRTGKQVLQWGRCYLWNPTDLINIEKPHFIPKIGTREGAYGLKATLPFGTGINIYDFVDTGNAAEADTIANALKVEFLLGSFEVAFSGWGKKGQDPVWGLDFSTRIFGIDTLGEIAVSQDDDQARAYVQDGYLVAKVADHTWAPRASLDFSRSFTLGDFKDQLTVMLEGFYQRSGYASNVLADPTVYPFKSPIIVGPIGNTHVASTGTQKEFIGLENLYQPNYFSRAYAAAFVTFTHFIISDMTLNANYIQNLVDNSGILSTGVTYTSLNSFMLGILANTYLGRPGDCEYTLPNWKYDVQLTFGISF